MALALAANASAQPATRRPTNIAALVAYPSFFHNRPILIVGTVATTDNGIRVSDDNGYFVVLFKGSAPDGLDEVRGEFWDISQLLILRVAQWQCRRLYIFLEMFNRRGPWNRQHNG